MWPGVFRPRPRCQASMARPTGRTRSRADMFRKESVS